MLVLSLYMDRNSIMQTLSAEATRRAAGQPPSNVGTRPNPSASQAATTPPPAPNMMTMQKPAMPRAGDPFAGASAAMNGSMPLKGGTKLENALIKRLELYPPA